jgi:hypothetical protein
MSDLSQQPDDGRSAPTPLLVGPVDELEPAIVIEPVHGVALLGTGTVIMGLTPPLSISVAPSGIMPPLSIELELLPGFDSGEAVPPRDSVCEEVQLDVEVVDGTAVNPPPSNVEVAPIVIPVPEAFIPDSPELQFTVTVGLTPPGSISVAPSGMPVPLDPLGPSVPSGEVAPIAGVLIEVCACPAPQPIRTTAAIASNLRIDISCRC